MRTLLICALALCLSACNLATSATPLFGPAESAGAPNLREGVWRIVDDRCRFRDSKPVDYWPKCAVFGYVRGSELMIRNPGAIESWRDRPILLVPGPILIAQVQTGEPATPRYGYFGVRPSKTNRAGQVVEVHMWPALCGPPPRGSAMPQSAMIGKLDRTHAPFAGMQMADEDQDCLAGDPATIRAAVRQSEGMVAPIVARWMIGRSFR